MAASAASNVFQIHNGDLTSLPERPMRQGFYGETLEAALQRLLQEHPEVIPGNQMVADDEESPCFLLLKREAPVGAWSLDHLFIDQFGVPTLVECKLLENREARREVVGQIVEYAANARMEWSDGRLRELANTNWSFAGNELDERLESELGVDDVDAFWQKVDANLEVGRIRLIIAGDHIHTSVQRMIEYLNIEMRNTEIYGLEMNCYGPDTDNVVMMTRVIGRVQTAADKRVGKRSNAKIRTIEELREYFGTIEERDESGVSMALLDWSTEASRFEAARTINPAFRILSNTGKTRLGVYGDEGVWLSMVDLDVEDRQKLHKDMIELGLTGKPFDDKKTFVLERLTMENIQRLIDYLK